MIVVRDDILLNKGILELLDTVDWYVRYSVAEDFYTAAIHCTREDEMYYHLVRFVKYHSKTNVLKEFGDINFNDALNIILDPSIDWHKDLIEMQVLEEL